MQEIVIKSLRWSKKGKFSIRIFNQNFDNQFLYVVELMRYRATSTSRLITIYETENDNSEVEVGCGGVSDYRDNNE